MQNINLRPPIYDPEAVQPMRDELTYVGFEELETPDKVSALANSKNDETTLIMINSVCGCAAGSARPGVTHALQNDKIPDRFVTSFAGQQRDAVDEIRSLILNDYPPSSPFVALIKNDEVLFTMPRHHIEGRSPQEIAESLTDVFNEHCSRKGPSIDDEKYAKLIHAKACGSKIPLNED